MECSICIESFNKSTRKPVTCPYCTVAICRTCTQTCLLQDTVAKCQQPECRKGWSDEFLSSALTKVWLNGPYREHREKVLLDAEKARLPESQAEAAVYINAKALVEGIQPRIEALKEQMEAQPLAQQRAEVRKTMYDFSLPRQERDAAHKKYAELGEAVQDESRPFRKQMNELKSEAFKISKIHVINHGRETAAEAAAPKTIWTFVGKCPTECMGYVGMDYACGLCKVQVCKECMEPKAAEHTCNTDNVLNVKALRKEAKPCPKCASMISKIDGCDQMWCTQCHTAFSWRTGAEETLVHNPHFYEWMRRTGQVLAPGAVQMGAGAPCGFNHVIVRTFSNAIQAAFPDAFVRRAGVGGGWHTVIKASVSAEDRQATERLQQITQNSVHMNLELRHVSGQIRYEETTDNEKKRVLRIRRLANEITDAEWKKPLESMQRASKRRRAVHDIYDMYIQAVMTLMDAFNQSPPTHIHTTITQYETLVNYTNEELRKVANRFSAAVTRVPAFAA
jgi:hypothetical protein